MFIGVDGEGKNNADGSHRYTLLACSTGAYIENDSGLSTQDCLDFLLSLREHASHVRLVGFSVDYDCNMILGDLLRVNLLELWAHGHTLWIKGGSRYYIEYIPSKHLTITRYKMNKRTSCTLWDTWGFFQCSFVKALEDWKVGTAEIWERIHAMKEQRGNFAHVSDDDIRRYCMEECTLLAELVEKLDTLFYDEGIKLSTWQGGGSAAVALLRKEGVKHHHVSADEYPEPVRECLLSAYFGGRAEVFHLGKHERVYNYDINSAYPTATLSLPTLRGVWRRGTGTYTPGKAYTLCRVQWKLDTNVLAPFPYRRSDGKIAYYSSGSGWYHGVEADTALELYPPGSITVVEWWEYEPESTVQPFAFVATYYEKRLAYKRQGDMRERPYKLALNSLYGKTAQGKGYDGKQAPYQSFLWAGYITAATRARLLRTIYPYARFLVGVATDGIFLTVPITGLDIGDGLGQWDYGEYEEFFIAQPGVYVGYHVQKQKIVTRNRGFSAKEINFDKLLHEWLKYGIGASVEYEVERFVKMGKVMPQIAKRDYSGWKRWKREKRVLTIGLPHKLEHPTEPGRLTLFAGPSEPSHPYTPKGEGWRQWEGALDWLHEAEAQADET